MHEFMTARPKYAPIQMFCCSAPIGAGFLWHAPVNVFVLTIGNTHVVTNTIAKLISYRHAQAQRARLSKFNTSALAAVALLNARELELPFAPPRPFATSAHGQKAHKFKEVHWPNDCIVSFPPNLLHAFAQRF